MNKKTYIIIAALVVVAIIIVIGVYTHRLTYWLPPPVLTTVSLGEEFTLKKGETARVKNLDVLLKLKDLTYSSVPRGSQFVWSKPPVVYELTVDGKIYGNPPDKSPPNEAPYELLIKETDYKT